MQLKPFGLQNPMVSPEADLLAAADGWFIEGFPEFTAAGIMPHGPSGIEPEGLAASPKGLPAKREFCRLCSTQ
jgi:hypothetical protein